jgi:hypothetical protein
MCDSEIECALPRIAGIRTQINIQSGLVFFCILTLTIDYKKTDYSHVKAVA